MFVLFRFLHFRVGIHVILCNKSFRKHSRFSIYFVQVFQFFFPSILMILVISNNMDYLF